MLDSCHNHMTVTCRLCYSGIPLPCHEKRDNKQPLSGGPQAETKMVCVNMIPLVSAVEYANDLR